MRPTPALALVLTGVPVLCSALCTGVLFSKSSGAGGGVAFLSHHGPSRLMLRTQQDGRSAYRVEFELLGQEFKCIDSSCISENARKADRWSTATAEGTEGQGEPGLRPELCFY